MQNYEERFNWAMHLLHVQASDRLLEIGCGSGILASKIAAHLKGGKITAIDRSSTQISRAISHNKQYVSKRTALFIEGDIRTARLAGKSFTKIFAFNVSVFWLYPQASLQAVKKLMRPDGLFYIFYQPPNTLARATALKAAEALRENQFVIIDHIIAPLSPFEAFALIARYPS